MDDRKVYWANFPTKLLISVLHLVLVRRDGCVNRWIDGCMDGWIHEMDGWLDETMDGGINKTDG